LKKTRFACEKAKNSSAERFTLKLLIVGLTPAMFHLGVSKGQVRLNHNAM